MSPREIFGRVSRHHKDKRGELSPSNGEVEQEGAAIRRGNDSVAQVTGEGRRKRRGENRQRGATDSSE